MARASIAAKKASTKQEDGKATAKKKGGRGAGKVSLIVVPPISSKTFRCTIKGETPLITHNWSEKAKKEMRDKQMGVPRVGKKEPKKPEEDFRAARYLNSKGKDCIHAGGLKNAIVDAASYTDGVTKVLLRGSLFVHAPGDKTEELIPIKCSDVQMREDMVRVGMGTADLRYRPQYNNWECEVAIEYDPTLIQPDSIINLLNRAGFSVGLHEWRPQRNGQFGRFSVKASTSKEAAVA